jgi:hypothetical protein
MQVGDLVVIKKKYHYNTINEFRPFPHIPLERDWIGLVVALYENEDGTIDEEVIYIQWTWSGSTVMEYIDHLEIVCE